MRAGISKLGSFYTSLENAQNKRFSFIFFYLFIFLYIKFEITHNVSRVENRIQF